jgi:multidrug efflux pump subunit AcrB
MISATFIKRPILASVLSIIVVIGGLVSMAGLPITQYPDIAPVQVTVRTCSICSRPVQQRAI